MRHLPLIAATSAALILGVASANAFGNISPSESPYAILEPQTVAPIAPIEGRSVFTGDQATPGAPAADEPQAAPRVHKRRLHHTPGG